MRIAITGGRGKVGRAVVDLALAQGHSVVSIDRVAIDETRQNVSSLVVDMLEYAQVENAFRDCDAIIHLAAIPQPHLAPDYEVHNNNVVSSYNALSAAARLGIQRVCQASSANAIGLAYSRAPRYNYLPLDEEHPTYNEDAYSLSKWICEQQADSFARRYEDMTIASMRFHWVVPDFAYAVESSAEFGEELVRHLWAYVTAHAAARACLLSLTANYPGHETFFVAAPRTTVAVPSLELKARHYPNVPLRGELNGNASFFNCAKAERMLGWKHDAE
mgnify:FL=1